MTLRIGHRGAAGYVDEDTLESMNKAISLKCDMIEFDVRKCKTDELIVLHDKTVNRTTNGKGFAINKTFDQIKKLRTKNGYKIPLLEDVLKLLKGKCKIIIEMKLSCSFRDVVKLVEKYNLVDDVIIASYYDWKLKGVKRLNHKIKTMLLCEAKLFIIKRAQILGCYGIIIRNFIKVKTLFVKKTHKEV